MKTLFFTIILVLFAILTYSGMSQPVWASTDGFLVHLGEQFQLKINETASVQPEGLEVKITKIQDSRCQSGVVCIWEGRANVWVDIRQGEGETKTLNMTTQTSMNNPSTVQFQNYSLVLLKVDPYPQKGVDIPLSNYTATLVIMHSDILSPLKQFKSGIAAQDVKCKQNFMLVTKASDGSPACVTPQTAQVLVERGWAKTINS